MVKVRIKVNIGSWGPPEDAAQQYNEMVARKFEFEQIRALAEEVKEKVVEFEGKIKDIHSHENKSILDGIHNIDSSLSSKSKNPVQNKVIKTKFDDIEAKVKEVRDIAEENAEDSHEHSNTNVLDELSDANGNLQYKGNPIFSITVDSKLSENSKNPVENQVVFRKFASVEEKNEEHDERISANTRCIENILNGNREYTREIELSINNDGLAFEVNTDTGTTGNCILYQYQGMDNEIPVGTKLKTIEFFVDDKWIDIHAMAELDRISYALNLHRVFSWDAMGGNVFCTWSPKNELAKKIESYSIDRIRLTYEMPRISFYVDGNLHHVEYAELNGTVQLPDAPEKDGHTFDGWIAEGSDDVAEFPYTINTSDVKFNAIFEDAPFKATFYADGAIVDVVDFVAGETITPDTPTKTGYDFDGWEPELPASMPAENKSYTAKWRVKTYDAVFKVDGEVYKTVSTAFGEKIIAPTTPTKTGYTFNGWNPTPGTMDAEGKQFEAKWTAKKINVYFMDGDKTIKKVTASYNTQVNAIADPTKQYYTFSGWKVSGNTANFPITVGEDDVYIRAEWARNTVEIGFYKTFYDSFGGYVDNIVYNCGDLLVPPEYPTEEGYVFVGWVDSYMLGGANIPSEFDDAFFDAYRLPEIVPDSNEVGDRLDYYPLYFKGGYIEAEEGYNDSENVWGYQEYQGRYNIFVGGSGSLERGIKNNKPWYDIERDNILYGLWMVFGHGITEITDVPYATFYVYLPSTIKKIHPNAFTSGVSAVYYEGTEEQWAEIEIGENNPNFENMTIYFNQSKITI